MSVNHVLLVGRLGTAPELRRTTNGKTVGRFPLATDRPAGRRDDDPDWHRIVVWDRTAETCERYLDKGRLVAVEGRLNTRRWEDDQGRPRRVTEVVAHRVTFLGGRASGERDASPAGAGASEVPGPPATGGSSGDPAAGSPAPADDLPF